MKEVSKNIKIGHDGYVPLYLTPLLLIIHCFQFPQYLSCVKYESYWVCFATIGASHRYKSI